MDLKRQKKKMVFRQFLTKSATVSCCARWDFSSLSRKRLLRAWSFETLIPAAATVYSLSRHSGFIWFLLRSFKLVDMYFKLFRPTLKTWQFYDKEDDIFQTKNESHLFFRSEFLCTICHKLSSWLGFCKIVQRILADKDVSLPNT